MRVFIVIVLGGLIALVAMAKPLRVYVPQLFGLTCFDDNICVEDTARLEQARVLRDDAVAFAKAEFGPFETAPHMLFCATTACFARFGNREVAALYFWGTDRLVINEIGWHDYITRHEIVHHWQAETYGVWRAARQLPPWYVEGMAYFLSDDPRPVIPNEAAQGFREEFVAWIADGHDWRIPPVP